MMNDKTTPQTIDEMNRRLEEERRKRDAEIVRLYKTGEWTFQQLADQYGLTKQRVEQIVKRRWYNE